MIVADASWLIALRDPLDPHHDAAVTIDDATRHDTLLLHPVTFAECLVGAAHVAQLDTAAAAIRASCEIVTIDGDAPIRWAGLRASSRLRLPDAIVLDTAIVHAARAILTFDERLGAEAVRRRIDAPGLDAD